MNSPYKVVPVEPTREMLKQLLDVAESLQRWAKAVPQETPLPAMPGLDGDYIAQVFDRARAMLSASPALAPTDEAPRVQLGPEAFRFTNFQQWVNKAQGWFVSRMPFDAQRGKRYVCIDAAGRICVIGSDFMRARDEEKFPIIVFLIDRPKVDTGTPSGDLNRGAT
jgi:hypothetical protein